MPIVPEPTAADYELAGDLYWQYAKELYPAVNKGPRPNWLGAPAPGSRPTMPGLMAAALLCQEGATLGSMPAGDLLERSYRMALQRANEEIIVLRRGMGDWRPQQPPEPMHVFLIRLCSTLLGKSPRSMDERSVRADERRVVKDMAMRALQAI